jgi:hypothetical protein
MPRGTNTAAIPVTLRSHLTDSIPHLRIVQPSMTSTAPIQANYMIGSTREVPPIPPKKDRHPASTVDPTESDLGERERKL